MPRPSHLVFIRLHPQESEGEIVIASADGSGEKILAKDNADIDGPSRSPDGKYIAVSKFQRDAKFASAILLFDVASGQHTVSTESNDILTAPTWMPIQKAMLVLASGPSSNFNRHQVGMISYPQGVFRSITNDTNDYPTLGLSADGKTIATVQSQRMATLQTASWDAAKGAGQPATVSTRPAVEDFNWSFDNKFLLEQENGIFRMDADGSNRAALVQNGAPSFNPISCDHGCYIIFPG
jgi:Tol biopolymer transport system component